MAYDSSSAYDNRIVQLLHRCVGRGEQQLRCRVCSEVNQPVDVIMNFFRVPKVEPMENPSEFLSQHAKEIGGSLCVFGDWFGRPMDNCHRVVSSEVREDHIKLTFDDDEMLEIWAAKGLKMDGNAFVIQEASRVRWEWFYYGRAKLPENRFFQEHVVNGTSVETASNVNWYKPNFSPSLSKPAVSIKR